ncbi:Late embryogenesis abundant protein, LEA-18 [Cucumis melo var. makuwa]|uniref:Late embryogenesis abundant protein, LEA-18 n=1 Tax=Cucumis melo var. makuwa TaxID=1194695 RepID=A0A5D3CLL7_CUCMM|nr:Late embryogenesis abundant protein, LEA-18 [Cucumis melo var. makuwa]
MEKRQADQSQGQNEEGKSEREKERSEGLPLESSPYVNYKDLEDYKSQAYGTQGHLQPKPGRGGGGGGPTDAPTLSGDAAASSVNNRQGVP